MSTDGNYKENKKNQKEKFCKNEKPQAELILSRTKNLRTVCR